MAGFALTIVLLESEALNHWAQQLEVTDAANFAARVTGKLDQMLHPLNIYWVRRAALADLDRLGWTDDPARLAAAQKAFAPVVPTSGESCAANTNVPQNSARRARADLSQPPPVTIAQSIPSKTPLPPLPPVAKSQPRILALAGDSMMAVGLSDILLRETAGDANVRVIKAFRSGTGLARPDVFDWTQEYPAMVGSEHPDAVIVAIGANDGQGFVKDGKVLAFGSDAWVKVYESRVATFLRLLTEDGATVVWVGLPPMKSAQYNQKVAEINRIAYSVVSHYPNAIWWNPASLIGDKTGDYREFVTAVDGHTTRLRAPDGIHFSDEGAMLLSPPLMDWLNAPPAAITAQITPPNAPVHRGSKGKAHHSRRVT